MAAHLSLATLASLPDRVATPDYDRSALKPGILHIGVGNFHRAHQAVYLDALFGRGLGRDFAVVGAGIRSGDARMRDALAPQDWLSTVVELDPEGERAGVTGAMVDFLRVGDGRAIAERLARPDIRIAALTVTEGGYCVHPATGAFDPDHPEIRRDAANPEAPQGVFGALLLGLRLRREAGLPPFAILSCDNLPGNGHVAEDAVAGLAALIDPALADWVRAETAFPNSMVDRITPATTDAMRERLARDFGVRDAWPVFCEPFRQWVLEDRFPQGRPPLEEAGATFTDRVELFELMKLRMLNGGHAAIAYPSALLGLAWVHEAMEHPLIRPFFDKLQREEIAPTVTPPPGVELADYAALIADRFANPAVGDTIARLAQDGSNRQPKFIVPTLRDRLEAGAPAPGLALELALWCRHAAEIGEDGREYALDDPNADRIAPRARAAKEDPGVFLAQRDLFGDLGGRPAFAADFAGWLHGLWRDGTAATLARYLGAE